MTIIHMDTERVREVARQMSQSAADMLSKGDTLRTMSGALSAAWQGGRSEEVLREYNAFLRAFDSRIKELQELALRLMREVDEWELTDGSGVKAPIPNGIASSGPKPGGSAQAGEEFSWYKVGGSAIEPGLELLKKIPYDSKTRLSWKGIGRWLNTALGNEKAGWVGKMDRLGHILRSPIVTEGLPLGLDMYGDLLDGDNWQRAVVSELIEFATEKGIYAIPVVGGAFAGYQFFLSAGHLLTGGFEMLGMHDTAVWLQSGLEFIDFTDRFGDAIYDFVSHPPNISVDVNKVLQTLVHYGCGLNKGL